MRGECPLVGVMFEGNIWAALCFFVFVGGLPLLQLKNAPPPPTWGFLQIFVCLLLAFNTPATPSAWVPSPVETPRVALSAVSGFFFWSGQDLISAYRLYQVEPLGSAGSAHDSSDSSASRRLLDVGTWLKGRPKGNTIRAWCEETQRETKRLLKSAKFVVVLFVCSVRFSS